MAWAMLKGLVFAPLTRDGKDVVMKRNLGALLLAALVALPASAAGITISGYVDLGYWAAQNPSDRLDPASGVKLNPGLSQLQAASATNGSRNGNDQFALNEINIDLTAQLTSDITALVSFDFIGGAAPVVDYAYIDLANPGPFDLNMRIGRVPSVIGIEQRVSESNQGCFLNLSLLSPFTVGSQDGLNLYGSFNPVNYAISLTNNDNLGGASMGVAPLRPGNNNGALGAVLDNNNNRAISGRIGAMPFEGIELGVSASHNVWAAPVGAGASAPDNKNAARNLVGADLSYVWGPLSLKAEYVNVKEEQLYKGPALGGLENPIKLVGWYLEGWYDWSERIGMGVRYNRVEIKQSRATGFSDLVADYSTISVAGAYRLADNVTVRVEYDKNDESVLNYVSASAGDIDNDVIAASLVASF